MQKYSQEDFFHLTCVGPNQSDEHNQAGANDFQRLIWITLDLDILNMSAISRVV